MDRRRGLLKATTQVYSNVKYFLGELYELSQGASKDNAMAISMEW